MPVCCAVFRFRFSSITRVRAESIAYRFLEVTALYNSSSKVASAPDSFDLTAATIEATSWIPAEVLSLKQKLSCTRLSFIILSIACSIVLVIETFIIR